MFNVGLETELVAITQYFRNKSSDLWGVDQVRKIFFQSGDISGRYNLDVLCFLDVVFFMKKGYRIPTHRFTFVLLSKDKYNKKNQ